ncbi:3-hydroxyacyl-ACP dehydratase [Vibrio aquaticus]|uniref:3-hydroxyacyl-ACP dehydratase n=1 Tax=Vibrio aquaticus TaxID=2496559 RepID=A0A432D1B9_9VIBR|nr:3-hydroxyacyl-ACP dehydratase [Vibrio aquaticus]RTZ17710.1 3-hydroxyacyl-ACP dehydratase [Vibrio aquaticus]
MEQRKPTITNVVVEDNQATLTMKVDASILDFRGHFTHFPLLPGVSQIDWALFYAIEHLNTPPLFKGMEVIKFQEPILPNATVELSLVWDDEKQKLAFKYSSQAADRLVVHSSGKMKLGE